MSATVVRIESITKHPNADRLEIITLSNGVSLVTGPHYFVGSLGVYIPTGSWLPGYLAKDLWLTGKANSSDKWVAVEPRNMRGVMSEGLFCGSEYQNDRDGDVIAWGYWQNHWTEGDDAGAYLGIRED